MAVQGETSSGRASAPDTETTVRMGRLALLILPKISPPGAVPRRRPGGRSGLFVDGGCLVRRGREERRWDGHRGRRGGPRPGPRRGTSGAPRAAGSRPRRRPASCRRACAGRTTSTSCAGARASRPRWSKRGPGTSSRRAGSAWRATRPGPRPPARGVTCAARRARRREVVAGLALEDRLLEESMTGDGEGGARDAPPPGGPRSPGSRSAPTCRCAGRRTSPASRGPRVPRWVDLHRTGGPEALEDRPSRPGRVPSRLPGEVRDGAIAPALEQPAPSPRERAVRSAGEERHLVSEGEEGRGDGPADRLAILPAPLEHPRPAPPRRRSAPSSNATTTPAPTRAVAASPPPTPAAAAPRPSPPNPPGSSAGPPTPAARTTTRAPPNPTPRRTRPSARTPRPSQIPRRRTCAGGSDARHRRRGPG